MEHARMIEGSLHQKGDAFTLRFTELDGVTITMTGPLVKLAKYTWSRLCQWDSIAPDSQFCCFSSDNPWQALHSLTTARLMSQLAKKG